MEGLQEWSRALDGPLITPVRPGRRTHRYGYRRRPPSAGGGPAHHDVDALGIGVEDDLGLAPLQLSTHLQHLGLERDVALAIVRAFAQHEGLDHAGECVGRELGVRYHDGRQWRGLVVGQVEYFLMSRAEPVSAPDTASMIHSSCFSGLPITRGMCTNNTKDPIMTACSVTASRARMPMTSATPAARCPAPVAQAQNT